MRLDCCFGKIYGESESATWLIFPQEENFIGIFVEFFAHKCRFRAREKKAFAYHVNELVMAFRIHVAPFEFEKSHVTCGKTSKHFLLRRPHNCNVTWMLFG